MNVALFSSVETEQQDQTSIFKQRDDIKSKKEAACEEGEGETLTLFYFHFSCKAVVSFKVGTCSC